MMILVLWGNYIFAKNMPFMKGGNTHSHGNLDQFDSYGTKS